MCDSKDSSDYSDDQNMPAIGELDGAMTPLNFTIYEELAKQKVIEKNPDCITFFIDFDKNKLTLKRNELNEEN